METNNASIINLLQRISKNRPIHYWVCTVKINMIDLYILIFCLSNTIIIMCIRQKALLNNGDVFR
jgi:hypothetical protein